MSILLVGITKGESGIYLYQPRGHLPEKGTAARRSRHMNQNQPQNLSAYTDTGYLKARVFTALGAIPLEGVSVKITSSEESNPGIAHDLLTNRGGETEIVELPAPPRSLSLEPSTGRPYSTYDIEAYLDGYYAYQALGVPVFGQVLSVQPIGLMPKPEYDTQSPGEPPVRLPSPRTGPDENDTVGKGV